MEIAVKGSKRWQHITMVLGEVLEAPSESRPALLEQLASGDSTVFREVESLLRFCHPARDFLEEPILPRERTAHRFCPADRIGPYQILDCLDRGGMGEVYLAVRVDDFQQRVALKVIRKGHASRDAVRRFENERQILAAFEHPNIARLLDGGRTREGLPYLVMEYVEGERIDRFCDSEIATCERLALFLKVCSAVEALHRNLVVHRDLKPSNILINEEFEPKLLDFGIAKSLQPVVSLNSAVTEFGLRPMTFLYASPEQVHGDKVTTSSDIYALGVLLYRLLTGRIPYRVDLNRHDAVLRAICEDEPEMPSAAIRRPLPSSSNATCEDRPAVAPETLTAKKLYRSLAGDLDSIVLKALRKEPENRYGSVEQLAADIRRHVQGLPVEAREATWPYRAGKFLRRNKIAIAVMVLIAILSMNSLFAWRRAVLERDQATEEHQRADGVSRFLEDLLRSAAPDIAGGDLSALDLLERGRNQLLRGIAGAPLEHADLTSSLGEVYREMGLYDEARELFGSAVQLWHQQYPEQDHPRLAKDLNNLAGVYYRLGDLDRAEELFRESLAMGQRLQQDEAELAPIINNVASILNVKGEFAAAEELYLNGLRIRERLYGPRSAELASSFYNLGVLAFNREDFTQAEALLRRALDLRSRILGSKNTRVATVLSTLGRVLHSQGKLDDAEQTFRQTLALRISLLGEDHPEVALTRSDLAEVLIIQGRLSTAEELLSQALESLQKRHPRNVTWVASVEGVLGSSLVARGQYGEAEPYLLRSYEVIRQARGERSVYTWRALRRLVELYEAWDRPEDAVRFARELTWSPRP